MWGRPLYGPMIFVDPQTRFAVANQADGNGVLQENRGVFAGTLPNDVVIANGLSLTELPGLFICIAALLLATIAYSRDRVVCFGLLWAVVAFLPVSS